MGHKHQESFHSPGDFTGECFHSPGDSNMQKSVETTDLDNSVPSWFQENPTAASPRLLTLPLVGGSLLCSFSINLVNFELKQGHCLRGNSITEKQQLKS